MSMTVVRLIGKVNSRDCGIFVGQGIVGRIGALLDRSGYTKALVVTDRNIPNSLLDEVRSGLPVGIESDVVVLSDGEAYKSLSSVERIWEVLCRAGFDRRSLVVNVGGGLVGDVGGFAASTFMRGIDFVQVPTTVASQADAGLGGKTGFNFGGVKNLIGTFTQPVAVVIDTQTLISLPKREFISGFAEIIKHGLIRDGDYLAQAIAKKPLQFDRDELTEIIERSCQIKASVVAADEREAGLRKILNFGHTIGHAVESLSHETADPLLHGEAVSIGMAAEARMAFSMGLLKADEYDTIVRALKGAGLPVGISIASDAQIIHRALSDKKNEGGRVNFTLLRGVGNAVYDQKVPRDILIEALEHLRKQVN